MRQRSLARSTRPEADPFGQGREPVLGRLLLALRPFDQQPLLWAIVGPAVTMADAHAQARKARRQPVGGTFPPLDPAPSLVRQAQRHLLDPDQVGFVAAPRGRRSVAVPGLAAGWPHRAVRLNTGHI